MLGDPVLHCAVWRVRAAVAVTGVPALDGVDHDHFGVVVAAKLGLGGAEWTALSAGRSLDSSALWCGCGLWKVSVARG